jgi:lactate dehydrogenase-like 2-hydroxyacid dehydrogenase
MALTLSCARKFVEGEEMMRENKFKGWHPKLLLGHGIENKVFGILGAGRIGSATAFEQLHSDVRFYTTQIKEMI